MNKSERFFKRYGVKMKKNPERSKLMEILLDVVYEAIAPYDLQQLDSSKICKIMYKIEPEFQTIIDDFKESVAVAETRKDAMIEWNIESLERLLKDWREI